MFSVTKELKWESAHRLFGYKGPCANIHGHSYKAMVTFSKESLDKKGFVIDFTDIKEKIQKWIDEHWDHACIVNDEDNNLIDFLKKEKMKYFIMKNGNPTAERMAAFLYTHFYYDFKAATLTGIKVYETVTSYAEYVG